MSGDTYYFGDNVNMHGGTHNTGIVKNQWAAADTAAASPELQEAVQELRRLIDDLRGRLPSASAQALDDSLPAVTADATVPPQDRHRALMAVAGIAATVGAIGQPVLDAVNHILQLLGAQ
ncbi:hypothetical protein [Streptomyces poonensis]|uniref:Uncharacterized protein n=1 Tax=Streptomyces poonensis TaxID=68255 RepID=A0A918PLQ0_9ACTN|nr:hypothetical protein [Streptomyces poonensis]GGZ15449.1 hypothetical protein GCM10010365_38990 [Streptomyces poonensis]GLJ91502.1 hypothetical protein GCM10017589_41090 [Streptomyces poonensis]